MQDSDRFAVLRDILDEIISAVIDSNGAVLQLTSPVAEHNLTSSIAALKSTVDNQCDTFLGLESLEADGPADSWLLSTEISSSAQPGNNHMFCTGPSWNRFVDKLTSTSQQQDSSAQSKIPTQSPTTALISSEPSETTNPAGASPAAVAASPGYASSSEDRTERTANSTSDAVAVQQAHSSSPTAVHRPSSANHAAASVSADVLHTPVRSARSSGGGTLQEAESAVWMASLRSAPTSNSSSRRLSRTQSASGASPHTPHQTYSKLAHSRSARVSAPGLTVTSPTTPASTASSRGVRQEAGGASACRLSSSSSSSKYSLRRSCPSSLVATATAASGVAQHAGTGSAARSPVISPTAQPTRVHTTSRYAGKAVHSNSCSQKQSGCKDKTQSPAATDSTGVTAGPDAAHGCNARTNGSYTDKSSQASAVQSRNVTPGAAPVMQSAVRAQAAADAAKATAQELMQSTMRITADSAAGVPLHAACEQDDEIWAADTTAVQLFMDEYKDVLDAVENAFTGCSTAAAAAQQEVSYDAAAAAAVAQDDDLSRVPAAQDLAATPATEVTASAAAEAAAAVIGMPALITTSPVATNSNANMMPAAVDDSHGAGAQLDVATEKAFPASGAVVATQAAASKHAVQGDAKQQEQLAKQQPETTPACGCGCTIM